MRIFVLIFCVHLVSCQAMIKDGETIASDSSILTYSQSLTSFPVDSKIETDSEAIALNDAAVEGLRTQKLDLAEDGFTKSFEKSETFLLPYLNLARLYVISEEENRARKVYDRLVRSRKISDAQLLSIGQNLHRTSRSREAVIFFQALDSAARCGIEPALFLGNEMLGHQEYSSAESYFLSVLSRQPHPQALFGKGFIRYQARDYNVAAVTFESLKGRSTEKQFCYYYLDSLFKLNRLMKAREESYGCRSEGVDLLKLKGKIFLTLNPFEDLSFLLAGVNATDRDAALISWFGTTDLRARQFMKRDLDLTY